MPAYKAIEADILWKKGPMKAQIGHMDLVPVPLAESTPMLTLDKVETEHVMPQQPIAFVALNDITRTRVFNTVGSRSLLTVGD